MEAKMKQLLEKYYAGETSLEEEKSLRNYFSKPENGTDFGIEYQLFSSLNIENTTMPQNFEAEMMKSIQESDAKTTKIKRITLRTLSAWVAAALLVFSIGFGWYFSQIHSTRMLADTYQSPEVAYQETIRVLVWVGSKMNKARQNLQPIEKIDDALKTLEPVGKVNEKLDIVRRVDRVQNPLMTKNTSRYE